MTQHQETKAKQRENDFKGVEIGRRQAKGKTFVKMKIPGQKGTYLIEKSRVELRKSQGYYEI